MVLLKMSMIARSPEKFRSGAGHVSDCVGAAVSYVNPGVIPIPLSGFAGEKGMVLAGFFDIDREEDTLRVSSFITLQKDSQRPLMYVGKELETVYCISVRASLSTTPPFLVTALTMPSLQPHEESLPHSVQLWTKRIKKKLVLRTSFWISAPLSKADLPLSHDTLYTRTSF